ncbi:ABC transporter substrate-binding protein [Patescibacteria group bacterium]
MSLLKNKKLILLLLISLLFVATGFKCGGPPAGLTEGKPKPITLNYWKVWEASSDITGLIAQYQTLHPHVLINYRNFTFDTFEDELLNALAKDRGPDIVSLHNTWQKKYQFDEFISPMPPTITMDYEIKKGTIQKQTFTEQRTNPTLTLRDIKSLFPDVVFDNQVINNQVWGLPLSIDTLALFYNTDLLNNAGIIFPPKDWTEFKNQVIKLTKLDERNNIVQSGAAIGTANNIERAPDILSLLMMQNNAPMTDEFGNIMFNKVAKGDVVEFVPAQQALNFYTSFASPAKQVYTWNDTKKNSLEAFMAGETAFFLGYAYHIPIIETQAPKINFEVAPAPQGRVKVSYANYWVETAISKSENIDEAWDFIIFMATNKEANKSYLDTSRKPTAMLEFIEEQAQDIRLSAFANQLLTAKSWYKGKSPDVYELAFNDMINQALAGEFNPQEILDLAVNKLNYTK